MQITPALECAEFISNLNSAERLFGDRPLLAAVIIATRLDRQVATPAGMELKNQIEIGSALSALKIVTS